MQPCFTPHHGPNALQSMKLHPLHYVDGSQHFQGTANIELCAPVLHTCVFMLSCSNSLSGIASRRVVTYSQGGPLDELVAIQSRLATIRCVRREEDQQRQDSHPCPPRLLLQFLDLQYSRDDKQGSWDCPLSRLVLRNHLAVNNPTLTIVVSAGHLGLGASSCALSTYYYEARKETPSFQSHIPAILRKAKRE